jgi:hypothetical protein
VDKSMSPEDVLRLVLHAWKARKNAMVGEYYLRTIELGRVMDEVEEYLEGDSE